MFVQVQQKWRRMYAGECQGPGVRTDFEMVHLRRVPSQYTRLSGLLDIFKSKIVSVAEQAAFTIKVDSKRELLLGSAHIQLESTKYVWSDKVQTRICTFMLHVNTCESFKIVSVCRMRFSDLCNYFNSQIYHPIVLSICLAWFQKWNMFVNAKYFS